MDGFRLWDDWLKGSLAHLKDAQLLRTLRPTVWCNSSSEAYIHRADLGAWLAGQPPVVRHYDQGAAITMSAAVVPGDSDSLSTHVVRHYGDTDYYCMAPINLDTAAAQDAGGTRCRRCGSSGGKGGDRCVCCCSRSSNKQTDPSRNSNSNRCHISRDNHHGCSSGPPAHCRYDAGVKNAAAAISLETGPANRFGGNAGCSTSSCSPSCSCSKESISNTDPGPLVRLRLYSLNDYLGLASHPEVSEAAARAARQIGMGPRSSALVAGYTHSHRQLEEGLAQLKGTEDCLLFPTGFGANLAVMTSLAYAAPTSAATGCTGCSASHTDGSSSALAIFSDELNHASIIDGARLASRGSGASGGAVQLHVYRHNDLGHLEDLLADTPPGVRRLVVTDSLFSMDGDFADLRGLSSLRRRHPFLLAVDEAHATLVCGEGGGGAAEAMGVAHEVDLHIGTLSKAFGALGGFVACSHSFKQLLLNRGRAFVYSTSLPVPVVEAAGAALRISQRESWRRTHVWSLVRRLGSGLGIPALSPVVPLVVGPEGPTLELSSRLLGEGLHVPAIRPPTVPPGTCRLRVSLSAAHSYDDVDELIRLVRQSDVPLVRLPHLLEPRAALPSGCSSGAGSLLLSSRL
ncbi:hypothetical protein Vafri_18853 [Volvox africanus]|uniref:Aminotransferase class I/classII large domain-containing protein n=1 Tax=Volvox africanus TaxID=51714 RepID=A0A8J4F834_9CHLO|nr:hypothetical protein Vafri_18853 [Volvox africanus]